MSNKNIRLFWTHFLYLHRSLCWKLETEYFYWSTIVYTNFRLCIWFAYSIIFQVPGSTYDTGGAGCFFIYPTNTNRSSVRNASHKPAQSWLPAQSWAACTVMSFLHLMTDSFCTSWQIGLWPIGQEEAMMKHTGANAIGPRFARKKPGRSYNETRRGKRYRIWNRYST